MRRAAGLLALGMVLVLAVGVLADLEDPDVQLLSTSLAFGGEICVIDNRPDVAVQWSGCGDDASTCTPTVSPGDIVLISPDISFHGVEHPFAVRFSWRRLDAPTECGFLVAHIDPTEALGAPEGEMDTTGLAPGCYVVTVWADSGNAVFESDELNNRMAFSIRIDAPQPNLHPSALRMSVTSPIERGETFLLQADVQNIGEADAGPFAVHFVAAPAEAGLDLCENILTQYEEGSPGSAESMVPWAHLGTIFVEGLARDGMRVVSVSVDTDNDDLFPLEGGQPYVVQVLVDPTVRTVSAAADGTTTESLSGAEVDESFEGDNCIATTFRLDTNVRRLPELRPISLVLTPPSPIEWLGSAVAEVSIENTGGSVPTEMTTVRFYYRSRGGSDADWRVLETYEIGQPDTPVVLRLDREPGIEQGRNTVSRSVLLHFESDPGGYELKVVVDADRDEHEQNEDNNELIIGFTIIGSELHPLGLSLASRRVYQGDSVAVSVDIENTGQKDVGDFTVGFFVDGTRMDTFYYSANDENRLAQGETARATGFIDTQDFAIGDHILRVVVDPDDRIAEVDEANNEISTSLRIEPAVGRKPELQVEEVIIGTDSGSSYLGAAVIQATVINRGDLAAAGIAVELLSCDACVPCLFGQPWPTAGEPLAPSYWIARLEPGERHVATWNLTTALPEDGSICVVIDGTDEIEEWDEGNNGLILGYSPSADVRPPGTNLACQIDSIQPSSTINPGVTLTIHARITNVGQDPVGRFRVDLQWMDPYGGAHQLDTREIAGLAGGQSVSIPYSVDTTHFPPGRHQVIVLVDVDAQVIEADENDNQCYAVVRMGPDGSDGQADLVPVSVRFDSPGATIAEGNTVEQDQPLYAYVTIRNVGNVPSGPFNVAFRTSLGVDTESWTSVGPLDQVEVSYPVPTGVPGTYELIIEVDPDGLLSEADADNNDIPNAHVPDAPAYTVAQPEPIKPQLVIQPTGSAVRWIASDPADSTVFAISIDGRVRGLDADGVTEELVDLDGTVSDVEWSFGRTSYAYVATSDGLFRRVDLGAETVSGEADLGGPIVGVAVGDGGRVYVAVDGGFHELSLSGASYAISRLVSVPGSVIDIQYDAVRQLIYVLSEVGLFAYGTDLAQRCDFDEVIGVPTALAVGGSGNYLGTATAGGSSSILHALSHCTLTGNSRWHILAGWRYPHTGSLPGTITSVVIDPRDVDPIYVATDAGWLHSLGFDGIAQWIYEATAGIHSTPLADRRTGRVFFGDDAGIPYILTLNGVDAFDIDLNGYAAVAIRSTLAIVETRERTDFGMRLFRNYYYGTEDGAVYKIASEQ